MSYNPNIHHRKSIRLKGYDYSQAGLYFITICVQDRKCLFGAVRTSDLMSRQEMILNDVGKIADECWLEIPNHFPNVVLHEHIVMPNHVHGILELKQNNVVDVGTRHVVSLPDKTGTTVGASHVMPLPGNPDNPIGTRHVVPQQQEQQNQNQFSKPISGSVSVIIQQYKSSVKRWCKKNNYPHFQWQSRFHDHIIRNEESYQRISEYIINNPKNWKEDKFYND